MPDPRTEDAVRRVLAGGMSRRAFITRAAALGMSATAISGVLAACGGNTKRQAQTAEGKAGAKGNQLGKIYTQDAADKLNKTLKWPKTLVDEPTSTVTLTVSHAWDASFWPRQQQFDKFFMQRHPKIQIKAENTPFAQYLQKYLTQAAGGNPPDVMYNQFAWAQNFISQNLFLPLDSYIEKQTDFNLDDFTKSSMGYYADKGNQYGIAYDCGPIMLFYNKDMFDQAGIKHPNANWTMDDMKDAAIKLTKGNGRNKVFGLSAIPYPGGDITPVRLKAFGGRFVDERETECVIDDPASVKAMEWWMDMYLKHKAMPSPADQQAMQQSDAFTLGRAAMAGNGSWATPGLLEQADFKWAIADWPKGPQGRFTAAEGSAYSITAKSPNQDAAWIYLNEYLSSAGQSFMWGSTGRGSPARNSAWKSYLSSDFAPEGTDLVYKALNTYATSDGVLYRPTTPEVGNTATPVWDSVVAGKVSVSDGCSQLVKKLNPVLAKNRG